MILVKASRFRVKLAGKTAGILPGLLLFLFLFCLLDNHLFAEGTRQLEPPGSPANSYCRIGLMNDSTQFRIPFAALGCPEQYRLNIFIRDFTREKIYIGFGDVCDYSLETRTYTDVRYQLKDPDGNLVPGFSLQTVPFSSGDPGYIPTRNQALSGPDINFTNPSGYSPLVVTPTKNGNYFIELDNPNIGTNSSRILKYFDATVAIGTQPVNGRLWSKAWQLSSGSVSSANFGSYAKFFVYSDDSIVTRFDCNGLAGGIWSIYSNQWGCSTSGDWSDRRRSVPGNATVQPQYKIFLNDPDTAVFASAKVGELLSFNMQAMDCDTVITFNANVNKDGNIEILIDAPPYNPSGVGPEDIQLVYSVNSGSNLLLPPWNGKDGLGNPLPNGTVIQAQIKFLNGLSNIPLFDVEDNPNGFKVDIQRPVPASGTSKLRIFWDDSLLPPEFNPTVNTADGCTYTGLPPVTGCHEWTGNEGLGNVNTVNSWWYYTTNSILTLPVTLRLKPAKGRIRGPADICTGQLATFTTHRIGMAQKYYWEINGPGTHIEAVKLNPDTTFSILFSSFMAQGNYTISLHGENDACGRGDASWFTTTLHTVVIPPVSGSPVVCSATVLQYAVPSTYTQVSWSSGFADIIGSNSANPVSLRWNNSCLDTLIALVETGVCGSIQTRIPVLVHPSAKPELSASPAFTTCPGLEVQFKDLSSLQSGRIVSRIWDWGDGTTSPGNDSLAVHTYAQKGTFDLKLTLVTDLGCFSAIDKAAAVIPYPVAGFTYFRNCLSEKTQFYDQSGGADLQQWHWNFSPGASITDTSARLFPKVVYGKEGQYPVRLIIANSYGCIDTIVKLVKIHPLPEALFNHGIPCLKKGVSFNDQSRPADTVLTSYSWKLIGAGLPPENYYGDPVNIVFPDSGTYQVVHFVTDAFGCSDSVSGLITPFLPPVSKFSIEPFPGLLHFINSSTGANEYEWNFGNDLTSTLAEPELSLTTEGNYLISLVATSPDGCRDTAVVNYYYQPGLWLPNAFTPNRDGKNDFFRPVTNRGNISPYAMQVFDRWGSLVFESNSSAVGWDGTCNGRPCAAGVYAYIIKFNVLENSSGKPVILKGQLSLIR